MTDIFEVYIIDRKTNENIPAVAERARRTDVIGLKGRNWKFNWRLPFKDGHMVYKITLNDELQGLIAFFDDKSRGAVTVVDVEVAPHNRSSKGIFRVGPSLFGIAAKYSFQCGQEGYIFFEAKTDLIDYYIKVLGAIMTIPPQGMGIFPSQSAELINDLTGGSL